MRLLVCLILGQLTVGCASVGGDSALIIKSVQQAIAPPSLSDSAAKLDPRFRYLWVQAASQSPVILVLGFEESTPNGLQETWYSADGGFIQTLNGRLSANRGLAWQWNSVRWVGQPGSVGNSPVVRFRDVLPAYGYGVADRFTAQAADFKDVPAKVLPPLSPAQTWSRYQWFIERSQTEPNAFSVPDAWFATGVHRGLHGVIASFQCMQPDYCIKTARWPLATLPSM